MYTNLPNKTNNNCIIMLLILIYILGLTTTTVYSQPLNSSPSTPTIYQLTARESSVYIEKSQKNVLKTFCYQGKAETISSAFETSRFILHIPSDSYTQYGGTTATEVLQHYNEQQSLFSVTIFSQKRTKVTLSPFESKCIGIASREPYTMQLQQIQIDLWRIAQILTGIAIVCTAKRLAKNELFYYIAGISIGICVSFLIIITKFAKMLPGRPYLMYGVGISGWAVGIYILQALFENLQTILIVYREYVMWYIIITGLISFIICYRIGPPKNPRSHNIITWVLQLIGSFIIYFSTWHTSFAVAIMILTLSWYYFPYKLFKYLHNIYRQRFPQPRKLLTLKEYQEQTILETSKSLQDLREFVNSPNCRQWKMVNSLHDPMRFARFAEGDSHLDDDEIEEYSRTFTNDDENDLSDEDFEDGDNNDNNYNYNEAYLRTYSR